uniref:Uncharacterized protein n=1 Tax=Cacopsylla melanoneura TaxID=428564 RepID=A0A8D8TT39_9HEMI
MFLLSIFFVPFTSLSPSPSFNSKLFSNTLNGISCSKSNLPSSGVSSPPRSPRRLRSTRCCFGAAPSSAATAAWLLFRSRGAATAKPNKNNEDKSFKHNIFMVVGDLL